MPTGWTAHDECREGTIVNRLEMTTEPRFYRLTIAPSGFSAEPVERSTEPYFNIGAVPSLRNMQQRSTEPFVVVVDDATWKMLDGKEMT